MTATSAPDSGPPKVSRRAEVRSAMARTLGSPALRMATPSAGSASISSALARATPSMPPTRSVWAGATTVTTPIEGRAISHSWRISPGPRMPISRMSASESSGAPSSVIGSPCSLLNDRGLAATRQRAATAAAARSFTDVLPTDPVMPTAREPTPAARPSRAQRPRAASAAAVSGTTMAVAVATIGPAVR